MTREPRSELARMGDALGALRWVQGPGGNVSVKRDGELWVKASGVRLTSVADDGGHVRLPLHLARRALDGDLEADRELFDRTPRPSLETYFHALDGNVVAHTHALGVLLYACATEAAQLRSEFVQAEIPYARPGRSIAVAMREALPGGTATGEHVIVLRSHGVVVIAESAERAIVRTRALDDAVRDTFGPLDDIAIVVDRYRRAPAIAFEGGFLRVLPRRETSVPADGVARYLFPDAVICASTLTVDRLDGCTAAELGGQDARAPGAGANLSDDAPLLSLAARALAVSRGRAVILVDREGQRAAVAKSRTQLEHTVEVAAAHDWLEDALLPRGLARYLPDDEPERLLDLPSEQYRIRLAATQG